MGKPGSGVQMKGNGGAFQPFHKDKGNVEKKSVEAVGKGNASATTTTTTSASTTESGSRGIAADDNKKVEKGQQQQPRRKQRRCWSSELHKCFLHALQQLGGSHGEFCRLQCAIYFNFFVVVVDGIGICFCSGYA